MQTAETPLDDKFAFMELLAADLSKGDLDLPSFPDIVIRVRQALEDEDSTSEQLVQIIGADPVLAARLLSVANSAGLRRSGDSITDLKMAVNRIGRSMVRSTAMSLALAQMRSARKLESVKQHLNSLWERCAHTAALCYVLARQNAKLSPDEALFVGLMHGIGGMYILVRADDHPGLFDNEEDMVDIMQEWNSAIGSSILENWGFAEHVSAAIGEYREIDRQHEGDVDYTDVLILANLLREFITASDDRELQLEHVPACRKMQVGATDLIAVLQESEEQIESLRQALGK